MLKTADPTEDRREVCKPEEIASATHHEDPLLECLKYVASWHGIDFSTDAVLAGLPLESGRLTPGLLLRAARNAGFLARLVERPLRKIPKSILPAVVLLDGNRAGVLEPAQGIDSVHVHIPETGASENEHVEIERDYSGFAVLLHPRTADAEERRPSARWWFWHTMWKFRAYYLRLVPAALMVSILALVMPLFIMLVYDRVVPNDAIETLWVLATGVVTVFAFEYLLRLLRGSTLETAGREMDLVLASSLYDQILALEMQARPPSPSVLAARTKAYEILREFFMSATMLTLVDLPFSLLMIAALFFVAGPVAFIVAASAAVAIIIGLCFQVPLRRAVGTSSESGVERQAMVSETVNGLESVKAANAEGALQHRFESMISSASEKDVEMHWLTLLASSTTATLVNLTTVAVVVAGVFRVKSGDMTTGGVIASVMITSRTMMPIAMVAGLMTRLQQALQALKSLNSIMGLARETGGHLKFVQRQGFDFNIVLDHVTVSYPGQNIPALSEVSLTIEQGQRIALMGRMGSGKSTLLRLLGKLYSPTKGEVLLDGVDLGQYHPAVVRAQIGYLAQDATVFRGSIRENVALGGRHATDDEILAAIRLAGLEEFVKRSPRGIYTQVGEQGGLLSGGQRRALVLARCFLFRPRLLLLDEPLANMDPQSEKEFVHALQRYLEQDPQRTLVVATHKTSMLGLVDHLIVLNEGRLYAAGEKNVVLGALAAQAPQHGNGTSPSNPTSNSGREPAPARASAIA